MTCISLDTIRYIYKHSQTLSTISKMASISWHIYYSRNGGNAKAEKGVGPTSVKSADHADNIK